MRSLDLLDCRLRLRLLQRRYYRGMPATQDVLAAEYIEVLGRARDLYLRGVLDLERRTCLHVGSGGHRLRGFINTDVDLGLPIDVAADLSRELPFRTASIDYIHSEDFLEHIDLQSGKRFIAEAMRVLKPRGVMRILTPDLGRLIQHVYVDRAPAHLSWCRSYLGAAGPCESLNMHLRMNGEHRYIYDEEHLTELLEAAGFRVRQVRFNWSPVPRLRYLDLRNFGLNMFLEAVA